MKIGIGLKVPYEPVLTDSGNLPPGSWDIILETGIGPSSVIRSEQDEILLIKTSA